MNAERYWNGNWMFIRNWNSNWNCTTTISCRLYICAFYALCILLTPSLHRQRTLQSKESKIKWWWCDGFNECLNDRLELMIKAVVVIFSSSSDRRTATLQHAHNVHYGQLIIIFNRNNELCHTSHKSLIKNILINKSDD